MIQCLVPKRSTLLLEKGAPMAMGEHSTKYIINKAMLVLTTQHKVLKLWELVEGIPFPVAQKLRMWRQGLNAGSQCRGLLNATGTTELCSPWHNPTAAAVLQGLLLQHSDVLQPACSHQRDFVWRVMCCSLRRDTACTCLTVLTKHNYLYCSPESQQVVWWW